MIAERRLQKIGRGEIAQSRLTADGWPVRDVTELLVSTKHKAQRASAQLT